MSGNSRVLATLKAWWEVLSVLFKLVTAFKGLLYNYNFLGCFWTSSSMYTALQSKSLFDTKNYTGYYCMTWYLNHAFDIIIFFNNYNNIWIVSWNISKYAWKSFESRQSFWNLEHQIRQGMIISLYTKFLDIQALPVIPDSF